jgi:hypothetical protein
MVARGGFDTEIGYVSNLNDWTNLNGSINFRLFWNHQEVASTVSTPGGQYSNAVNTSGTPRDRFTISLGYRYEGFSVTVTEQIIAGQNWFGTTNPPTTRYVVDPPIPAYFLTGLAMTYDFNLEGQPVTGFLNINNLFNVNGPITGGFNGSPGMLYPTPNYADVIGRYFTLGFRVRI